MTNLNIRELKARGAALAGEHRSGTRSLVLLYCGVIAALSFVSNGLNLYLNSQIGGTGGLDGLGLRSMLQTVQEILTYINLFFGPFWSAGFLGAMLVMVRGRTPQPGELAGGFRRFGRVLGYVAFEFGLMMVLMIAAVYLGSMLFAVSSWGMEFAAELGPVLTDPNLFTAEGAVNLELIPMDALMEAMWPVLMFTMAAFLPPYIFLSYSFRMALYLVMERPIGAVQAHILSARMMRRHKWQLFRMDLSYWWYYLLGAAVSVIGYLDMVLELMGIAVPIDPMVLFFGTLAVYCVLYTLLCLWKKCEVDAAYVLAYESIAYPEQTEALSGTE